MIRPEQTHPHLVGSDQPPRTGMARLGSIGARWLAHGLGRPIERFGAALRRLAADDGGRPHFEADRERRRFALAVKSMPIGLCLFDADHRLVICNRRYAEMYGLPDSLIRPGTHWHEIIRFWIRIENYDAEQAEAFFERLDRASYQKHVSTETIHLPGNRAYNLLHQPLDGGGWVATHEDVSERHQAEREIARLGEEAETERRRLEAALTNMPIGLTMFDADKRLITANPSFRRLYDLPDHLVRPGTPFRDILEHRITTNRYPGGDPTTWIADLMDVVDRHEALRDVLTFRNGSTMRIVHQPTPEGGWVTIHEDVTERYGAQLEIARLGEEAEVERQRLEAALSNMPIGLTMFDGEKRLITTNRRYAELYGLPDNLLKPGTPFRDLMDFRIRDGSFPADGAEEWVQELFSVVERGESTRDLTELKNGRFVSIIHEPMVGGGWIATHEDVTERHLADREINRLADEAERERRRLDTAMSNMPIGVCLFDGDKRLIAANSHYAEMYRLAADRLVPGMTVHEVLALHVEAGNNGESDPDEWTAEALRIAHLSSDWRGIKPTASGRTHSILIKPLNGGGWVSTHEDVTERFEAQQEILRLGEEAEIERQRLNAAVNNMPIGLVMFDAQQRLIVANGRYAEMYRMPRRLTAPGTPLEAILAQRTSAGEFGGPDAAAYDRFVRKMVDQREPASDILRFRDGRIFSLVFQPMKDGGWVTTHEDVTDRQKAQAQIAHMAHHDYLTDLPNRVLFRERIEQALARDGAGKGVAVLCLDLDHFKAVNDTLGHPVGDKLLQAAARRLSALVRDDLTVARLGGDEFALLQIGADQPKAARKLAQQIIEDLSAPYKLDGHQVVTGVSIGIAVAPDDGDTADKLLKNGDMALYRAKGDGRGLFRFFESEMDARMQARRALEVDLRRATEQHEFELYYQPQFNLGTGSVTGFEALLRWRHPDRGLVSPAEFIPLAEETGLILPIGEWVLAKACAEAAKWPSTVTVAVNLSPVQFRSAHVLRAVVSALSDSGLPAHRLELEITESVLLMETESTLALLNQLHILGVRISMDDFGTGYSSLGYLQKFRFDKIKIDREFIKGICDDEKSLAIIKAVTGLSASMGIATTAEGVETQAQLSRVKAEGCTEVQGFLTGRPMAARDAMALLQAPSRVMQTDAA